MFSKGVSNFNKNETLKYNKSACNKAYNICIDEKIHVLSKYNNGLGFSHNFSLIISKPNARIYSVNNKRTKKYVYCANHLSDVISKILQKLSIVKCK